MRKRKLSPAEISMISSMNKSIMKREDFKRRAQSRNQPNFEIKKLSSDTTS